MKKGILPRGKSAPDRKKIGMIRKLKISWNPWGSSILEARATPRLEKDSPIRPMKTIDRKRPPGDGTRTPRKKEMTRKSSA